MYIRQAIPAGVCGQNTLVLLEDLGCFKGSYLVLNVQSNAASVLGSDADEFLVGHSIPNEQELCLTSSTFAPTSHICWS